MALLHSVCFPAYIHIRSTYNRNSNSNPISHTNRPIISMAPISPSFARNRTRNKRASALISCTCCENAAGKSLSLEHQDHLPTMSDILRVAETQNVKLQLKSVGPLFTITATSVVTGEEVGRANGFITIWFGGKILHLESIRMTLQAFKMQKSIFGMGLLVGAMAIRYGYDCNCIKAELLAINDSELYHSKLVRFYTRMGFKAVYEVTGSSFADIIHMLAWGGIGTRMDASIQELLTKWSYKFRPPNWDNWFQVRSYMKIIQCSHFGILSEAVQRLGYFALTSIDGLWRQNFEGKLC